MSDRIVFPGWIEDFKNVAPLDEPIEWNQSERVKDPVSANVVFIYE